ncbi:MAG: TIGR03905 family TSCPD domain-containing protein [Oscillospiraceae bacterium]|nr:TIGR03905 family TSCPD domain-containing protein [Oscillospiraceae bacterium]
MVYNYRPSQVCSVNIRFELEGNVVHNVVFTGGCNGNLKAIGILVEGMTVEEIESKLRGNTCGFKSTSCADQLARAVREAYDKQRAN